MSLFNPLKKEDIRKIVDIQLSKLEQRLKEKRFFVVLDESAKEWLSERGYDEEFGARPLKRLFQQEVENPLALQLLDGVYQEGDTIHVKAQGEHLSFYK